MKNGSAKCSQPKLEGDDIDAFIARFERTAKLYEKMESEEIAIEYFSCFTGKALSLIHSIESEKDSYGHMKTAVRKGCGRTAEGAKLAFCSATIADNESAVQAHAKIAVCFMNAFKRRKFRSLMRHHVR